MSRLMLLHVLTGLLSTATAAHPGHYTLGEVEWNEKSQRFEVALRVPLAELEDGVANKLKRRVSLEHAADREKFITEYLQDHISITRGADRTSRIHWVGMEFDLHDAWLYFEVESITSTKPTAKDKVTPSTATVTLRNTMLHELHPKQLNLMNLRMGRGVTSVNLTADTPKQTIPQTPSKSARLKS